MMFDIMQCYILICVRTTCTEACTEKPLTIVFRLLKAVQSLVLSIIYYAWLQRAPVVFLFSAVLDNNTFSTFFHLKYHNSLSFNKQVGLARKSVFVVIPFSYFLRLLMYRCVQANIIMLFASLTEILITQMNKSYMNSGKSLRCIAKCNYKHRSFLFMIG